MLPPGAVPTRMGPAFAEQARTVLNAAESLRGVRTDPDPVQHLRIAVPPGLPPAMFIVVAQLLADALAGVQPEFRVCCVSMALCDPNIDVICQLDDALRPGP